MSLFTKIKEIIDYVFGNKFTEKELRSHKKLCDKFLHRHKLEIDDLREIQPLIENISEKEATAMIRRKINRLIKHKKVEESPAMAIKNKKDYRKYIKSELKRVYDLSDDNSKRIKRILNKKPAFTPTYKNDLQFVILPSWWDMSNPVYVKLAKELPLDEILKDTDTIEVGDVPLEEEVEWFNEKNVKKLNSYYDKHPKQRPVCENIRKTRKPELLMNCIPCEKCIEKKINTSVKKIEEEKELNFYKKIEDKYKEMFNLNNAQFSEIYEKMVLIDKDKILKSNLDKKVRTKKDLFNISEKSRGIRPRLKNNGFEYPHIIHVFRSDIVYHPRVFKPITLARVTFEKRHPRFKRHGNYYEDLLPEEKEAEEAYKKLLYKRYKDEVEMVENIVKNPKYFEDVIPSFTCTLVLNVDSKNNEKLYKKCLEFKNNKINLCKQQKEYNSTGLMKLERDISFENDLKNNDYSIIKLYEELKRQNEEAKGIEENDFPEKYYTEDIERNLVEEGGIIRSSKVEDKFSKPVVLKPEPMAELFEYSSLKNEAEDNFKHRKIEDSNEDVKKSTKDENLKLTKEVCEPFSSKTINLDLATNHNLKEKDADVISNKISGVNDIHVNSNKQDIFGIKNNNNTLGSKITNNDEIIEKNHDKNLNLVEDGKLEKNMNDKEDNLFKSNTNKINNIFIKNIDKQVIDNQSKYKSELVVEEKKEIDTDKKELETKTDSENLDNQDTSNNTEQQNTAPPRIQGKRATLPLKYQQIKKAPIIKEDVKEPVRGEGVLQYKNFDQFYNRPDDFFTSQVKPEPPKNPLKDKDPLALLKETGYAVFENLEEVNKKTKNPPKPEIKENGPIFENPLHSEIYKKTSTEDVLIKDNNSNAFIGNIFTQPDTSVKNQQPVYDEPLNFKRPDIGGKTKLNDETTPFQFPSISTSGKTKLSPGNANENYFNTTAFENTSPNNFSFKPQINNFMPMFQSNASSHADNVNYGINTQIPSTSSTNTFSSIDSKISQPVKRYNSDYVKYPINPNIRPVFDPNNQTNINNLNNQPSLNNLNNQPSSNNLNNQPSSNNFNNQPSSNNFNNQPSLNNLIDNSKIPIQNNINNLTEVGNSSFASIFQTNKSGGMFDSILKDANNSVDESSTGVKYRKDYDQDNNSEFNFFMQ